jgi:hypothetical protein
VLVSSDGSDFFIIFFVSSDMVGPICALGPRRFSSCICMRTLTLYTENEPFYRRALAWGEILTSFDREKHFPSKAVLTSFDREKHFPSKAV